MRPLLSTRLLSATCCSTDSLRLARNAGFPSLELRSDSVGGDLFRAAEVERVSRVLTAEGTRAAWLQIGPDVTSRLDDPAALARFGHVLGQLRLEGVTVVGAVPDGPIADLLAQVEMGGARLCLERDTFSTADLRRWPRAVDLSWDLAAASRAGAGPGELDRFLGAVPTGRLLAVRVSGVDGTGHRVPPGEREALLLEEVWRRLRPEYVVYDVEDPSGFGAATSLGHVLDELRAFHSGAKHPHATQPWGLFGSGLAPG